MKSMFPRTPCLVALIAVIAIFTNAPESVSAQLKKVSPKPAVKKTEEVNKSKKKDDNKSRAEKDKAKSRNAKDNKRIAAADKKIRELQDRKKDSKDRSAAKDRDRDSKDSRSDAKSRKENKAESQRAAAERRRIEEERRQAALAEQRRREQAAREARERRLAFERGLRTQTVANISRDNTEGEDLAIRQAAISALGSHAGSVVVMEAQTGKVLTIVNQDWAVRSTIRPCSTIKLVTGVAGINEGMIDKTTGAVKNVSTRRDLDDALAYSDNPYFQRVGAGLGNSKLVEYGKDLGLGEPTGINLEGEAPGRLPTSNNNARIYSHGDDTEVSTLQLAVMVSAITNGGKRVLPRVPRNEVEKASFQTFYRGKVDLPQQSVRRVIPGMMGAAEYGTARRGVDAGLGVAGKTGSCIDKGSWVGLFASVAPVEQPKYAVAVITRGQSERGRHAAAIAGQVYRALSRGIVRTDRNLAQTEFKLRGKNPVDLSAAAKLGAAEEEDEFDAEVSPVDGRGIIVVPDAGAFKPRETTPKKLVTKTGNSKPVFPPVVITYDKDGNPTKIRP